MIRVSLLVTAMLLAGCAATTPATSTVARQGLVSVQGQVHLKAKTASYKALSLRQEYTYAHLSYVAVYLLDTTAHSEGYTDAACSVQGELNCNSNEFLVGKLFPPTGGDNQPLTVKLNNLKALNNYAVRLEAWQVDPKNGESSDPVRVDTEDSVTPITTISDSDPSLAVDSQTVEGGFTLDLKDQAFSGDTSANLDIQDGGWTNSTPITITASQPPTD